MASAPAIEVERAYDPPVAGRVRVLVDRLWPRGVSKERAALDRWDREVAPSTELRRWYGHVPERFDEFAERYRAELAAPEVRAALDELRSLADDGHLSLVTATRDVERSGAVVLREVLAAGS